MTRRFLMAHGLPFVLAAWTTTALALVLARHVDISIESLVGGTPRKVDAADVLCVTLAAILPGTAQPRMRTWEQLSSRPGLRIGTAGMAAGVLLATPVLTWLFHTYVASSAWHGVANCTIFVAASSMTLTALGAVNAAAPLVLTWCAMCLALIQHSPATAGVVLSLLESADHPQHLALLATIAGAAVTAYAAPPQRVSLNFAGRPSLRARVASSKLSVRIRK